MQQPRANRKLTVRLSTCGGAAFDSVLAVYRGCSWRTLREIDSNDEGCGTLNAGDSRVTFTAWPGRTYHIAVPGFAARGGQTSSGAHWVPKSP